MAGFATLLSSVLFVLGLLHPQIRYTFFPVHVMTAWTEREGEIAVRWSSGLPVLGSSLRYRRARCADRNVADESWTEVLPEQEVFFKYNVLLWEVLYTAMMSDLDSSCTYEYVVGGTRFPSQTFSVSGRTLYYGAQDEQAAQSARVIVYGDMGRGPYAAQTRAFLRKYTKEHEVVAILHLGDVAYDLDDSGGKVGDEFLSEIEDISASLAYMLVPGNHETAHNFTHFRRRFRMPVTDANEGSNFFYSFNLGPAHFVMYSTEVYSYCSEEAAQTQFNWLRDDLLAANSSRRAVPWVFVLGHKPLYCSVDWRRPMASVEGFRSNYNCGPQSAELRTQVEDLLYESGVDLYIAGHVHKYEREAAVYRNETVLSEHDSQHGHYNAHAPVHIISGIAGSDHLKNPLSTTPQQWSRCERNEYGFGVLTVINKTHVLWEQLSAETEEVTDFVWVAKEV